MIKKTKNKEKNVKYLSLNLEILKLQILFIIMFLKVKKKIHKKKKNHPLIKKIILVLIQLKENQDLVQEVDKKEKKIQKRQKEVDLNNLKIEIMKNKIKNKEMTK